MWRDMWVKRLETVEPFIHTWLYVAVPPDPGRVLAPRQCVRGRGIARMGIRRDPDRGLPPGPAIGFLQETPGWWDYWLGLANRVGVRVRARPGPGP